MNYGEQKTRKQKYLIRSASCRLYLLSSPQEPQPRPLSHSWADRAIVLTKDSDNLYGQDLRDLVRVLRSKMTDRRSASQQIRVYFKL